MTAIQTNGSSQRQPASYAITIHKSQGSEFPGVVIPLGAVVAQLMASALANGDGGLDHSGLLLGVERLSGRTEGADQ